MSPCVLHDSPIKRDLIAFRMEINCSSEGDIIVTNFEHFLSFFIHSRIFINGHFQVHALFRFHTAISVIA